MGIARYCVSFNFALGCSLCVMSKLLGMTLFFYHVVTLQLLAVARRNGTVSTSFGV